jgi:cytosine/adenosine deaminase-related metal-dependent hydrolase
LKLDIKAIFDMDISMAIGTDGLSSNNSLSMFDELRSLLFIHSEENCVELSKKLLSSATIRGANALGFDSGSLIKGKNADFLDIKLDVDKIEQLELDIILHTKEPKRVFIRGELQ